MKLLFNNKMTYKITGYRAFLPILLVLFFSLFSHPSFALACDESSGGAKNGTMTLPSSIAVSNTQPDGTILWRSADRVTNMRCYKTYGNVGAENVHMYINPKKISLPSGVVLGVHINHQDYNLVNGSFTKVDLGVTVPACRTKPDCSNTNTYFSMSYYYYIQKQGTPPSSGSYSPAEVNMFQLDGALGLNVHGNQAYRGFLNGLNKIRFIACVAKAQFSPSSVNLGKIVKQTAATGQRADSNSKQFALTVTKQCADDFGVNIYYDSPETISADNMALELDNGLNLKLKKSSGDYVNFKKVEEDFIVRGAGATSKTETYTTELYWRESNPATGAFSTSATVTLSYK